MSLKEVRYLVRKRVDHTGRFAAQQAFVLEQSNSLRASYYRRPARGFEPFAALHREY